ALWWPAYPWAFEWPENVVNHRALMRDWNAFYRGDGSRMQPSHSRMVCPDWDRLRPRDVTTFNPRFAKRVMKAPRMQPTFLAEQWACALLFQRSKVPVAADYILALGLFSYFAGTDKFVVERLLLDPLVTRLPPSYGGRYSYHINPNFQPN